MYETFRKAFKADGDPFGRATRPVTPPSADAWLNELLVQFGGRSFNKGLYRVVAAADIAQWNDRVAFAFPSSQRRITCFGYDWLGRAFALDSRRQEGGQPGVLMFEPGTGEELEIPCTLSAFHDRELIDEADAAVARGFHESWLASGGAAPSYNQCVGYKIPLFLGGSDQIENLEASDLDVYWEITGQLIRKMKEQH